VPFSLSFENMSVWQGHNANQSPQHPKPQCYDATVIDYVHKVLSAPSIRAMHNILRLRFFTCCLNYSQTNTSHDPIHSNHLGIVLQAYTDLLKEAILLLKHMSDQYTRFHPRGFPFESALTKCIHDSVQLQSIISRNLNKTWDSNFTASIKHDFDVFLAECSSFAEAFTLTSMNIQSVQAQQSATQLPLHATHAKSPTRPF
jgi:hypothetical protein